MTRGVIVATGRNSPAQRVGQTVNPSASYLRMTDGAAFTAIEASDCPLVSFTAAASNFAG